MMKKTSFLNRALTQPWLHRFLFLALFGSFTILPQTAPAIVDLDADTLDDIWEERFGAQSVLPGDDEDGDGKSNIEECLAGTDPFDAGDCLNIADATISATSGSVTIPTKRGKMYAVQIDDDLQGWVDEGTVIYGTGGDVTVDLSDTNPTDLTGSISQEIWVGVTGGNVSDLTNDPSYPANPSGTTALPNLEIPENVDDNYGGRIRGFIKPPVTGNYVFYLSSRNSSQLFLSSDENPGNCLQIASLASSAVLSGDADKYTRFASQQSSPIALTQGQKYYVEILHKHAGQEDHMSVAWDRPDTPASTIELVTGDHLCPLINPTTFSTTGLDVYYDFEEGSGATANDSAGADDNGTLAGSQSWILTAKVGSGLSLNPGTLDQVNIPDSTRINSGEHAQRTVALWFKAFTPTLATKQIIYEEGGQTRGFNIYLENGILYVGGWNNPDAPENGWGSTFHQVPFTDNVDWHHVALVLDATPLATPNTGSLETGVFRAYLDGVEFARGDGAEMNNHTGDIAIGGLSQDTYFHDGPEPLDAGYNFDGCVDEFRLWNRGLKDTEIAGLAGSAGSPAPLGGPRNYMRLTVVDLDSDLDGLSDWSEFEMSGEGNFSPYDPDSTAAPGADDLAVVTAALGHPGGTPDLVNIVLADATAYEDPRSSGNFNAPTANIPRNPARFRLRRTTLQPITVQYNLTGPPAPAGSASPGIDYNVEDINGAPLSGSVTLGFGQVTAQIVVDAIADVVHEYPEHARCELVDVGGPGTGAYDLGGGPSLQDCTLYDALDIPEQEILFVGRSSEDPASTLPTQGSGIVSGFLNGEKDFMRMNSLIMAAFSSPQNDSHIHKANAGPTNGPITYDIFNIPGDPGSNPKVGELLDYPWPIEEIQSGFSGQVVIDSLFTTVPSQGSTETPMYLNWHTNNNQGGELWAILEPETGSIDPPDPPAAPPGITPLAGAALEREVRRFLNQATFGATDKSVADMLALIASAPHNAAPVPRISAFNAWIDDQIDNIPQTYLVDYTLAADMQEWKLRGYFDATRWNPSPPNPVPTLPGAWPAVDRTQANGGLLGSAVNTMVHFPENEWVPTQNYPLTQNEINWGKNENVYVPFDLGEPNHNNRRRGHWLLMLNAKDQLRQKTGYALQQILVVSEKLTRVRTHHIAAANYQDQINYHAFNHFRDQFEWVNWSPIMGKWLSSLKNQQALDVSVPADGIPDVFPDENLAREDMQLFSIGLITLWRDGTLKLSEQTGLPEPTYLNNDITEFARVLTGQSFSRNSGDQGDWGIVTGFDQGDPFDTNNNNAGGADNDGILWNTNFNLGEGNKYYSHQFNYPMRMFGANHDPGTKTLAGGKLVDNTGDGNLDRRGRDDIQDSITWFAGQPGSDSFDMVTAHQSTPAFISERLIQRLTKSNPSTAYLYRVADAFAQDGGNLRDTVKAILLDYEVRELVNIDGIDLNSDGDYVDAGEVAPDATSGLKKPPLDSYIQLIRNFSQRDTTGGGVFTEGAFTQYPIADPAIAGPIPENARFTVAAPPGGASSDGYLNNFGLSTAQAGNFTMNSVFLFGLTDTQLTMSPFAQDTVFNYFLPGFSPGGPVSAAGLVAPELQIATETSVIRNVNHYRVFDVGTNGQGLNDLGGNPGQNAAGNENKPANYNARLLYGDPTPDDAFTPAGSSSTVGTYDNVRIAMVDWGENIVTWAPVGTSVNSVAAFDDIVEMVDAIDLRIMDGRFKAKYPIDPGLRTDTDAANEDAFVDGINPTKATTGDANFTNDKELRNPREIIVKAMYDSTYNPYSTNPAGAQNAKRDLFRFILEVMTGTPEFNVHK